MRMSRDLPVPVGDIDMGAGFRERLDAGKPDALRAASHDRDPALEIETLEIHGSPES